MYTTVLELNKVILYMLCYKMKVVLCFYLTDARKPAKMLAKVTLSKSKRDVSRSIRKICTKTNYRCDLKDVAVRRARAILNSQQTTPTGEGKRGEKKRS